MLSQVSIEAAYTATYVENYLDYVENLPNDLQRLLSRMRELDVSYRACLREVQVQKDLLETLDDASRKSKATCRIQQALIAAQELGDEKLNVVQSLLDLIESKTRQIDLDYQNIVFVDNGKVEAIPEPKEPQIPICNPSPAPTVPSNSERQPKRARRTRHETYSGSEVNQSETAATPEHVPRSAVNAQTSTTNPKKTTTGGTGKKKKRKSRGSTQTAAAQREESPPRDEDPIIDPDEPTYCLCDQISYGEMIMCDNDLCPIEWFHFSCVSLSTKPKGKWFCPKCRGDRPNVMKPKAQFLRELERFNKEKEEKT